MINTTFDALEHVRIKVACNNDDDDDDDNDDAQRIAHFHFGIFLL